MSETNFNFAEDTPQEFIDALDNVKIEIRDEIAKNQNAPAETLQSGIMRIFRNFAAEIINEASIYRELAYHQDEITREEIKTGISNKASKAGATTKNEKYEEYCKKEALLLCEDGKKTLNKVAEDLAEDYMDRKTFFRRNYGTTLGLRKNGSEIDGYSPYHTIYGWLLKAESLKKFVNNKKVKSNS